MQYALMVAGLGFGDEGKGSVVDWLVRRHGAELVVRYNGGPQAAHHVVLADGRSHCFAQLGAGALVPGVRTFLSRYMLIDPLALKVEAELLARHGAQPVYSRLTIDPRCVIVTPFHRLVNQLRELARGAARHGSCGRGVAEAQLDSERGGLPVVRVGEVRQPARLLSTLRLLWRVKIDQAEQLIAELGPQHPQLPQLQALLGELSKPYRAAALAKEYGALLSHRGIQLDESPPPARTVVFEGAQGVLLDRHHGLFPYVTPSRTTWENAVALLDEWAPAARRTRVGVLRAYATRHGAGPLPTEDPALTARLPERHNRDDPWQGSFRLGWFDGLLGRYALRTLGGVDALVVTCLDRLAGLGPLKVADSYHDPQLQERLQELPEVAPDHRARAALSTRLQEVAPEYRELAGWDEPGPASQSYVAQLGTLLATPIAALSHGPTAEDKQVLLPEAL
jgi:adenylosuccinate synthase